MIVSYSHVEVVRLITEAREDDEVLRTGVPSCRCKTADLLVEGHEDECAAGPVEEACRIAQRRTLANLRFMTDQLEAAQTMLEALAAQVDQTDPKCPIGAALTRAGEFFARERSGASPLGKTARIR